VRIRVKARSRLWAVKDPRSGVECNGDEGNPPTESQPEARGWSSPGADHGAGAGEDTGQSAAAHHRGRAPHRRWLPPHRPLIAVGLLALGIAAPAWAGHGSTTTSATPLPHGTSASLTATCPHGSHATGGGFATASGYDPQTGEGAQTFNQVSGPAGRHAWRATSASLPGSSDTTLSATVRCARDRLGDVVVSTEHGELQPGQATTLRARCGPTRRLVGGGYVVTPVYTPGPPSSGPRLMVLESHRSGKRDWLVTGVNLKLSSTDVYAGTLEVRALCATGSGPVKAVSTAVPLSYDTRASAQAQCPPGFHTLSGGFALGPISADDSGHLLFLAGFVDASTPVGSSAWRVSALGRPWGNPANGSGTLTSLAYCERS